MSDFGTMVHVKKCRKPYTCVLCGRKIPAGNPWDGFRGIFEGDFQTWKACRSCAELVLPNVEEYLSSEDFVNYVDELATTEKGCADWEWSDDKQSIVLTWENGEKKTIPYPWGEIDGGREIGCLDDVIEMFGKVGVEE